MTGFAYMWEFQVAAGCEAVFEEHYGPDGTWASLFRRSPGYVGTLLLKDATDPLRYITIDRWVSAEAYRAFRERFGREYAELDRQCEALTTAEKALEQLAEVT